MKEAQEVTSGKYLHEHNESEPYYVFGLANLITEEGESEKVCVALWVDGFEKTGKVSGERLQIYKSADGNFKYKPIDPLDAPRTIVFYQQKYEGAYDDGQPWGRSVPDFLENFEHAASPA